MDSHDSEQGKLRGCDADESFGVVSFWQNLEETSILYLLTPQYMKRESLHLLIKKSVLYVIGYNGGVTIFMPENTTLKPAKTRLDCQFRPILGQDTTTLCQTCIKISGSQRDKSEHEKFPRQPLKSSFPHIYAGSLRCRSLLAQIRSHQGLC